MLCGWGPFGGREEVLGCGVQVQLRLIVTLTASVRVPGGGPRHWDFFLNLYLFLRDRQSTSGGGTERDGDTESEAGSRPWGISTESDMGLDPMNREIMT